MASPLVLGSSSSQWRELQLALRACLECANDNRRFVNESEPILGRFHRALLHTRRQKFADMRELLDSIQEKDKLVHFFLDCVRNRFLLWVKVADIKKLLSEDEDADSQQSKSLFARLRQSYHETAWSKAFNTHIRNCATCQTVDLNQPRSPAASTEPVGPLPIPFAIELLGLAGVLFPLFAIGQGCDCALRPWLVVLGILLCLPAISFAWLCHYRWEWILSIFLHGNYSSDQVVCEASIWWIPSSFLHMMRAGTVPNRNNLFTSFGYWSYKACISNRASIQWMGPKDEKMLALTCAEQKWEMQNVQLQQDGKLTGPTFFGTFDGDKIHWIPMTGRTQEFHWIKVGSFRKDWMAKFTGALLGVGLLLILVATLFPPGLVFECGPVYTTHTRTVSAPLKVMFLMDSSGSIEEEPWAAEKQSVMAIIEAFQTKYSKIPSRLHVGVAQFSSTAKLEIPLSNNLESIKDSLSAIKQHRGGTQFSSALDICQSQLSAYVQAGADAFDLCVLITDGSSPEDKQSLKGLLSPSTKLMGIFVGTFSESAAELEDLASCDEYPKGSCPYFAPAQNFDELQKDAAVIANGISQGLEKEVTEKIFTYTCDLPMWTWYGLLGILPFVSWWLYLNIRFAQCSAQPVAQVHRDPQRLWAAGGNLGRDTRDIELRTSLS